MSYIDINQPWFYMYSPIPLPTSLSTRFLWVFPVHQAPRALVSCIQPGLVILSEKCKSKPQWGTITRQSGWLLSISLQAINAREGIEKREPSYTVGGNAIVQPLWRTVWRFLKKLELEMPYDPAILLLGIHTALLSFETSGMWFINLFLSFWGALSVSTFKSNFEWGSLLYLQCGHNMHTHLCWFICSILPDYACFHRVSPHHLPLDQSLWVLSLKIYNFSQKLLFCWIINVWNHFMRTF